MLNWKNIIENCIYILLIGTMMIVMAYVVVGQFDGMVQQAIAKETTSIKNEFKTEIKKINAKKGAVVELTTSPDVDNKAQTNIVKDSIPEKKGFFKRIFKKNKSN